MLRTVLGILSLSVWLFTHTRNVEAEPIVSRLRVDWEQTADNVEQLSRDLEQLAARVNRLKKARLPKPEQLSLALRRSVLLQAELEAADRERREATKRYRAGLKSHIKSLDTQMRALVPALREGSHSRRRKAAQQLARLRQERITYQGTLKSLMVSSGDERWADFARTLPPAYTPEEMEARADFLEDVRDKLASKREAVVALVKSSSQRRDLEETEYTFLSETSLFDEQARVGRVLRQQAPSVTNQIGDTEDGDSAGESLNGPELGGDDASPPPDTAPGGRDDLAPPPATEGGNPQDIPNSVGPLFGRPTISPDVSQSTPSSAPEQRPASKRIPGNLSFLLELDLQGLNATTAQRDLERLLEQLQTAERTLTQSAKKLRKRAETMLPANE